LFIHVVPYFLYSRSLPMLNFKRHRLSIELFLTRFELMLLNLELSDYL